MRIQLFAFATASEALGAEQADFEIADGATVAGLREELSRQHPALAELWPKLAIAVDGEIVGGEAVLVDGCEVALLPPVSGGAPEAADEAATETGPRAWLTEEPLDAAAVSALVGSAQRGAVVLFVGTVRDHHQGRDVERLSYSAYRPMALARIERILDELEAQYPQLRAALAHRLGTLDPGEASVVIATAAPHRAAAYAANRTALERLKAEVPIWKREHYTDGESRWREEESLRPSATARPRPQSSLVRARALGAEQELRSLV
jgi:molybdopterin synthase catalytic subunit